MENDCIRHASKTSSQALVLFLMRGYADGVLGIPAPDTAFFHSFFHSGQISEEPGS